MTHFALFYQIQSDKIVWRVEQQRFNFFVGKLEQDEFVVGLDQQNAVGIDAQNNVISWNWILKQNHPTN